MAEPTPAAPSAVNPPVGTEPAKKEIKLISHSTLFYWWPVWAFGFFMALWTFVENNRMANIPHNATVKTEEVGESTRVAIEYPTREGTKSLENAARLKSGTGGEAFLTRVSHHAWLGSVFTMVLLLTVMITNIPLRGLWSFVVIILLVVIGLFVTVFHGWDRLFDNVKELRVYINLAGYLFIATVVFILWATATFVFDHRTYMIVTPGQIKVCEHIGDSVRTYDTAGLTFEKQRADLFRHYILGFGSGDLIVRTAGADRHEIVLPNVLGIGWKLKPIEDMLRERAVVRD